MARPKESRRLASSPRLRDAGATGMSKALQHMMAATLPTIRSSRVRWPEHNQRHRFSCCFAARSGLSGNTPGLAPPEDLQQPLTLPPDEFGRLVHELLRRTVDALEPAPGFIVAPKTRYGRDGRSRGSSAIVAP